MAGLDHGAGRAAHVMSATGPVVAHELGRTLVHEHITIGMPGQELDPMRAPDRREIVAMATDKLQELRSHGVGALVDPCPVELGRDPELYAEVSQRSGVRIIFATGFYYDGGGIPHYWRARDSEEIADFYLHELEHGAGGTGLRPGVIKAATGLDVTPVERTVLAAAAMAQRHAGCAIITHTEQSRHGDVQQDIFAQHGADLSRVLIGHQDEQPGWEAIRDLALRGTFVGIDRVGYDMLAPDERRADHVAALIRAGHLRNLCLSQDCICTVSSPRLPFSAGPGVRISPAEFLGMMRPLSHVLTTFAGLLRERGVSDADLDTIFRDNPRRLLTGV